jgi:hypothetical protein
MAQDKSDKFKKSVSSTLGRMSAGSVIRSADQSDESQGQIPILVHTDQGPVVLKLAEECSDNYNAWWVRGDLPEPPFPTEQLFCDPKYTLESIDTAQLTISGTNVVLSVDCGALSGDDVEGAQQTLMWMEIGSRHNQ